MTVGATSYDVHTAIAPTGLTDAQKNGRACRVCGRPFVGMQNAVPAGRVLGWGLVFRCARQTDHGIAVQCEDTTTTTEENGTTK
jgi:hypothetical protein